MHATLELLEKTDFPSLKRAGVETLQINLGYRCNQQCLHCHVNAGPRRKEAMSHDTVMAVLDYLRQSEIKTLDITGGAPEMNPHFRELVTAARAMGIHVMDRCNLTILEEPDQADLAGFLASQGVEIIASLPCYLEENVDRQRGKGVFSASIRALKKLNALGYAGEDGALRLNLVYNPQGPVLPPPQDSLEQAYKKHLGETYGIVFNQLFTITNMPIQRFGSMLISKGQFEEYMSLLRTAFQPRNLDSVMCRHLISVDWQGYVYDCDFNQLLGLPMRYNAQTHTHISQLAGRSLAGLPVTIRDHCYGCTAGQGSSCGGALK